METAELPRTNNCITCKHTKLTANDIVKGELGESIEKTKKFRCKLGIYVRNFRNAKQPCSRYFKKKTRDQKNANTHT